MYRNNVKKSPATYEHGEDFWRDLVLQFGKDKALLIANDYLDLPMDEDDNDEFSFRCELYRAAYRTA